jgi:hypothetical protein
MTSFSKLFVVAVLGVLSTAAAADEPACRGCAPQDQERVFQGQEITHRDQIKADRAKYDLENEKSTAARPWDAIKSDKLSPEKK